MAADERPRERLLHKGGRALSDAELIAVLLRTGRRGTSALDLARELLRSHGGLLGLQGSGPALGRHAGLGPAKIAALLAALELARRFARADLPEREPLAPDLADTLPMLAVLPRPPGMAQTGLPVLSDWTAFSRWYEASYLD